MAQLLVSDNANNPPNVGLTERSDKEAEAVAEDRIAIYCWPCLSREWHSGRTLMPISVFDRVYVGGNLLYARTQEPRLRTIRNRLPSLQAPYTTYPYSSGLRSDD